MLSPHAANQSTRTTISPDLTIAQRAAILSTSVSDSAAIVLGQQGSEYIIAIARQGRCTTIMARRVSQFELGDKHSAEHMHVNRIVWTIRGE